VFEEEEEEDEDEEKVEASPFCTFLGAARLLSGYLLSFCLLECFSCCLLVVVVVVVVAAALPRLHR